MSSYYFGITGYRTTTNEGLWKFLFDSDTEMLSLVSSLSSFPLPVGLALAKQSSGKIIVNAYDIASPSPSRLYRVDEDLSGFDVSFGEGSGYYDVGNTEPCYGISVDYSDDSIFVPIYHNTTPPYGRKISADGASELVSFNNGAYYISHCAQYDPVSDQVFISCDSVGGGYLVVSYDVDTGSIIDNYELSSFTSRWCSICDGYLYFVSEQIGAVYKYLVGGAKQWNSGNVSSGQKIRTVFCVGDYVVVAGVQNTSSDSIWLLSSDGVIKDGYNTGGEVRGGILLGENYFAIASQSTTNEDGQTVNVSVFRVNTDTNTIVYVTGYNVGISSETMVSALLLSVSVSVPVTASGGAIASGDSVSADVTDVIPGSSIPYRILNMQLDIDRS